ARRLFSSLDTAPSARYTPSLHDALPISKLRDWTSGVCICCSGAAAMPVSLSSRSRSRIYCMSISVLLHGLRRSRRRRGRVHGSRSEEHTSELQSRENLVCRLLLEKKNKA